MKNSAENNKTISISINEMAVLMVKGDYCGECNYFKKGVCEYFNSEAAFYKRTTDEPCLEACKKYLKKEFKK